ncbi:uncharacterized protein LOC106084555 [Stomoxys calcitrans]|uniref:uncharacterized protein LOC106084555 n=1 Tax=Stomoxys calcitrans TaxID=35570 RepID=UPI0027E32C07|nr:uncharacterized protein LOC106084555 [Stomoxys calcitrans]
MKLVKIHERRKNQRLIPLTEEIIKIMMNINSSHTSFEKITDMNNFETIAVTTIIRDEIQNVLQEPLIRDKFIRKEDMIDCIKAIVKEEIIKSTYANAEGPDNDQFRRGGATKIKATKGALGLKLEVNKTGKPHHYVEPASKEQFGKNQLSIYDEMYYERRQYLLNLLYYKKSSTSLTLIKQSTLDRRINKGEPSFW